MNNINNNFIHYGSDAGDWDNPVQQTDFENQIDAVEQQQPQAMEEVGIENEKSAAEELPPQAAPKNAEPKRETVQIGKYTFEKIPYDKLEPGDIVCTYESVSTNPHVVKNTSFQKYISGKKEMRDLHKLLHFEIILEKHKRAGCYKIAHANGTSGLIVSEEENFHNIPGMGFVVLRPKNKLLANEIADVARKTAVSKNKWSIGLLHKPLHKKAKRFFSTLFTQNKNDLKAKDKTFQRLARMAIETADPQNPGFY